MSGQETFTKGPWQSRPCQVDWEIIGPNGEELAIVNHSNGLDEPDNYPARANAKLIAAAPDLLDALREAREYVATFPVCNAVHLSIRNETLARIDAALKKAGA